MRLITLGPKGTFSEEAALRFYERSGRKTPLSLEFSTIPGCLRAVERFQADYAVLPAENMVDGIIGTTFDALIDFHDSVKVCDELHLPVHLVLAAAPSAAIDNIRLVLSHPSPLSQCLNNLAKLLPHAVQQPTESTAAAVKMVQERLDCAAVCSPKTAKEYGLKVIHDSLADYPHNETRFLLCSLADSPPTGNDRTLLAVRFGVNQPGQLHAVTGILAERGIDLSFVQSRPYKVRPQDYVLLFELSGHKNDPLVEEALSLIEQFVRKTDGWKKVLGSFPQREKGV
ncbi:MAG TPA: ACT domain-containing protein [Firmicutes bacterium]|nr:ACT domain-containing protein [Bacillota bacterium]